MLSSIFLNFFQSFSCLKGALSKISFAVGHFRQLDYITTLCTLCQAYFFVFLKTLSKIFMQKFFLHIYIEAAEYFRRRLRPVFSAVLFTFLHISSLFLHISSNFIDKPIATEYNKVSAEGHIILYLFNLILLRRTYYG